ncbi:class I SAM-dependent RNA methyltransferase [Microbacterium invictum]|uniref:tRNA/tmRNA/rRNA uracil-C5-methylase (TrmA/RlmC/RlmD family) n=1 Tax=Microbacterium invictum TaxID=515415 RepID=A0AA40SP64_9MICO|nr:class I SAM-dependent RNA methyltransferase [Microbacterium invictum]MBB4139796.1 tRNA/tmRNA/rRNA uracil-C5-methylase (TrmA/RlmC/RlmD family) [Microbacterium invictum]
MDAGDLVDLDVTDVAHGGVFVARHEGRVVFVPDAIPGERVRARLTDTRKSSFWRGEALEVLAASPHRRPHVWRQADIDTAPEDRPGGADFGHIALDHQRELKLHVVRDALQRIGGLDLPVTIEGAHPARDADGAELATETADGTGWRTRVSLHVDDAGRIGPYAARSHRVIEVDDLPLATGAIAAAALQSRSADGGGLDFIQPADGRVRIVARPDSRGAGHLRSAPEHAADRRAGSPRNGTERGRSSRGGAARGPRRGGARAIDPAAAEVLTEVVGGREFRVGAGGFWQVHRLAATTLTDLVTDGVESVDPDAWHLDLYGGVGLLAAAVAFIGGPATKITTVESDPRATDHAGANLADWVGARAETGRVDRWLAQLAATASPSQRARLENGVVVLDPPRAGAGREVVERLVELNPARVVYVACDPVALSRDLAIFRTHGFTAQNVRAVDLFPHSHHVEAVTVLSR